MKCLGTGFACEVGEIDTFGGSRWDLASREAFFRTGFQDLFFDVAVTELSVQNCILSVATQERPG